MLTITIKEREIFLEDENLLITVPETKLRLEHSLDAISKWESKYKRSFFKGEKTPAEVIYYIRCMSLDEHPYYVYGGLSDNDMRRIEEYTKDTHTATVIKKKPKKGKSQDLTSELIYCWMVLLQIPFETDKWNFNRLMMLIQVCNEESNPKKKMSSRDSMAQYSRLNAARRQAHHTKG